MKRFFFHFVAWKLWWNFSVTNQPEFFASSILFQLIMNIFCEVRKAPNSFPIELKSYRTVFKDSVKKNWILNDFVEFLVEIRIYCYKTSWYDMLFVEDILNIQCREFLKLIFWRYFSPSNNLFDPPLAHFKSYFEFQFSGFNQKALIKTEVIVVLFNELS